MPYVLGIDVGTSRTRAAVARRTASGWADPALVALGGQRPDVPTVLYLAADRSALVGADAERHAGVDPGRIARGFTSRIGDDIPLFLDGAPCTPQELAAVLIRWVADLVAEQEGGPAEHVVITHRASWGGHRKTLLHHELIRQGLGEVTLVPEPIAAAESYRRLEIGDAVVVYGHGGGVAQAAVVRKAPHGFELLSHADGADHLGAGQFDDALYEFVNARLGTGGPHSGPGGVDPGDHRVRLAIARLRAACIEAKEILSAHTEVTVPVRLPGVHADVTVGRSDFEELIRAGIAATVSMLPRVLRAAALEPRQLIALMLVGGSVRIPLVAELAEAAVPVRADAGADAECAVAIGAAFAARAIIGGSLAEPPRGRPVERTEIITRDAMRAGGFAELTAALSDPALTGVAPSDPWAERVSDVDDEPPPRPPVDVTPLDLPGPGFIARLTGARPLAMTIAMVVVVAVGVVLTFMFEQGSSNHSAPGSPVRVAPAAQQAANDPSGGGTGR
jgi:molecular chaperone DnaK (HSP70)